MLQDCSILQRGQQRFWDSYPMVLEQNPQVSNPSTSLSSSYAFPPAYFPCIPLQSSIHVPRNVGSENIQYRQALLAGWRSPERAGGKYVNRQQAWGFFSQGTFTLGLS